MSVFLFHVGTTRWAKNGVTVATGLSSPCGLWLDENDNVVVADAGNHRIMSFQPGMTTGTVVAGGNGQGNAVNQLNRPTDVLVDIKTNSYIICERDNRRVTRWSRRQGTQQGETLIDNIHCFGLTLDHQRYLYVTVDAKGEVKRYRLDEGDKVGTVVAGGNGAGEGLNQLYEPRYVCIDSTGALYISDWCNHRVMKWMPGAKEGIVVAGGRGHGSALTRLAFPEGVRVDESGNLYVADWGNSRVIRWCPGDKKGTFVVGGKGNAAAFQFGVPNGVCFDRHGHLYVSDAKYGRVLRFSLELSESQKPSCTIQ